MDIREINPLTPIWPSKPGQKVDERKRPPQRQPREKRDEERKDEDDDTQHIDDYA